MQLFPDEFDAVVFDGYVAPDLVSILYYDYGADAAGTVFMNECGRDSTCAANLGNEPIYNIHLLYELLRAGGLGECGALVDADTLRGFLGGLIRSWNDRVLIGPVVKRMLRCNKDDLEQLRKFVETVERSQIQLDPRAKKQTVEKMNDILDFNILMSELFFGPGGINVSAEVAASQLRLLSFGSPVGAAAGMMSLLEKSGWPVYTPEAELYGKYPQTSAKVLIMTGTTDPMTPTNWFLRAQHFYTKEQHHFVPIPNAVHETVFKGKSPVRTAGALDCGMQLAGSFFNTLGSSYNASCLDDLLPVDYAGTRSETQQLSNLRFGTPELWGADMDVLRSVV